MSAEMIRKPVPDQEKQAGFRDDGKETQPVTYYLPILPWDEIVQKWPKVRFSSFFPAY